MVDNGGPAFPGYEPVTVMRESGYTEDIVPVGGMSLRDYFAAKALGMSWAIEKSTQSSPTYKRAATRAYAFADEMLEARK
jgi:hypothetical protein